MTEAEMGIALIITRSLDKNLRETGLHISLNEWLDFVCHDETLRLRSDPWTFTNPSTKDVISVPVLPGQTELAVGGQYVPFLGYQRGDLVTKYLPRFEDERDPVRRKLAKVARTFAAIITHDAGDEILEW